MNSHVTTLNDCYVISLPELHDKRGSLGVIENRKQIPFDIQRIYFLHGVPKKEVRGEHAHKELSQVICALAGSFKIDLSDGENTRTFCLNNPHQVLFICPMIWRKLYDFSDTAACLVLASHFYDAEDYIHDFAEFQMRKGIQ